MIPREDLDGLEDDAFTQAAVAANKAAAAGNDARLDRAKDAAIRTALAAAYRAATELVRTYGAEAAMAELQRRAAAFEAGNDPDQ